MNEELHLVEDHWDKEKELVDDLKKKQKEVQQKERLIQGQEDSLRSLDPLHQAEAETHRFELAASELAELEAAETCHPSWGKHPRQRQDEEHQRHQRLEKLASPELAVCEHEVVGYDEA